MKINFHLISVPIPNNIDFLRALAVLAVFIHHAQHVYGGSFPFFGDYGGQFGPQLFFLISGYLIVSSWDKYSWREYACHRFFRIMPAYVFYYLAFGFTLGALTYGKISTEPLYFLVNIFLLQQLFPIALAAFDVLHVTWTLTVELLWYLAVPLFALMLTVRPWGTLVGSILVSTVWSVLAAGGYLNFLFPGVQGNPGLGYLIVSNNFLSQLCFFIFGAWVYRNERRLDGVNPLMFLVLGVFVFILRPYYFHFNPIFITGLGLMCFLIAVVKMTAIKNKAIFFLSEISYSVYLCHFPILLIFGEYLGFNNRWGLLASVVATLVISFFSHKYIEKPGIRLGRHLGGVWKQKIRG